MVREYINVKLVVILPLQSAEEFEVRIGMFNTIILALQEYRDGFNYFNL